MINTVRCHKFFRCRQSYLLRQNLRLSTEHSVIPSTLIFKNELLNQVQGRLKALMMKDWTLPKKIWLELEIVHVVRKSLVPFIISLVFLLARKIHPSSHSTKNSMEKFLRPPAFVYGRLERRTNLWDVFDVPWKWIDWRQHRSHG